MAEQATQLGWLEIVFSGPGAAIIGFATISIFMFLIAFSNTFRGFFKNRNLKLGYGDKMLETSPTEQPTEEIQDQNVSVQVQPVVEETDDPSEMTETEFDEDQPSLEEVSDLKYQMEMINAGLRDHNPIKIEEVYQEWLTFEDRKYSDESIETLRSNMRLKAGILAAEDELKVLEDTHDTWTAPSFALSAHYMKLERFDLARPHAQIEIDRSENEVPKSYAFQRMAEILIHLETKTDALKILEDALSEFSEADSKVIILDKIVSVHEVSGNKARTIMALEYALNLIPNNNDRRFKLAFKYADKGEYQLALYHYRILADQDPNHTSALNNLGAAYDSLNLSGKCVESWKLAANYGEAYPMGNLANKLITNGFYDEARKVIDEVPDESKEDTQVVNAIGRLKSVATHENAELDRHIEAMKIRHKYVLLAVEGEQDNGINQLTLKDHVGDWISDTGEKLNISQIETAGLMPSFSAMLTEPATGSLPGGGLFGMGYMTPPAEKKYQMNMYEDGLVITGTGYPLDQQVRASILGGQPPNKNYFLVVTSKSNIKGIYWSDLKNPMEISFTRI